MKLSFKKSNVFVNTPFTNVIRLDTTSLNLGFCSAFINNNIKPKIPAGPKRPIIVPLIPDNALPAPAAIPAPADFSTLPGPSTREARAAFALSLSISVNFLRSNFFSSSASFFCALRNLEDLTLSLPSPSNSFLIAANSSRCFTNSAF